MTSIRKNARQPYRRCQTLALHRCTFGLRWLRSVAAIAVSRVRERNRHYGIKWMHELNLPNMGNPKRQTAFRNCEKAGTYSVKSDNLRKFAVEIHEVFKHIRDPIEDIAPPYYRDEEEHYKCFKENLQ